MPPFPWPTFDYDYDLNRELRALNRHRDDRGIPRKSASAQFSTSGTPGRR